jgi:hypothetical protein
LWFFANSGKEMRGDLMLKKTVFIAVASLFLGVTEAQGAGLVNIQALGYDFTAGQSAYGSSVAGSVGDTINYEIVAYLSPSGTHNTNGNRTLGTQVVGTDGLSGTNINLAGGTAVSGFTTALPTAFQGGLSHSTGTLMGNGATDIIPILATGNYLGADQADEAVILTGSFKLQGNGSLTPSYDATDNNGGVLETFLTAGPGTGYPKNASVTMNSTSEAGADPVENFAALPLSVTPEPATLGLLAFGMSAVIGRRRR